MTIALSVLAILAAADVVVFAVVLVFVGWQYRRLRLAADASEPLPRAAGQFFFVGTMLALGVAVFLASLWGLVHQWSTP